VNAKARPSPPAVKYASPLRKEEQRAGEAVEVELRQGSSVSLVSLMIGGARWHRWWRRCRCRALSVAPVSSAEAPVQALSERRRGRERERLRPRTADSSVGGERARCRSRGGDRGR
jgi:hypothetical protein